MFLSKIVKDKEVRIENPDRKDICETMAEGFLKGSRKEVEYNLAYVSVRGELKSL